MPCSAVWGLFLSCAHKARDRAHSSQSSSSNGATPSSWAFRRQATPDKAFSRRCLPRPRLWHVLLGVFVANVVSMACLLSIFWYDRSARAVDAFLKSTDVTWSGSIDEITTQLHHYVSNLEDTIVSNILAEPQLAVELNTDLLRTWYEADPSPDRLLNHTFLQLARRFRKIEGLSFTFPSGRFVEFERNSHHPGSDWRRGNYTFEYTPGDDANASWCEVMCPPSASLRPGSTNQFSVDDETGQYKELLMSYPWDVRTDAAAYQSAVRAAGATVWADAYVYKSGASIGIRASRAYMRDGQVVAVTSADMTLDNLSDVLRSIELASQGRIYIMNRSGQMIASSGGLQQVIGFNDHGDPLLDGDPSTLGPNSTQDNISSLPHGTFQPLAKNSTRGNISFAKQLFWNMTDDPLIQRCTSLLINRTDHFRDMPAKGPLVVSDQEAAAIYSAFVFRGGSGPYAIEWIIINAQPLSFYKGLIQQTIDEELHHQEGALTEAIFQSSLVTACFVLVGTIAMAWVARAVTRPLTAISRDMRAVADFERGFVDRLLDGAERRYGVREIKEVSDICRSFTHLAVGLQSFSRYMDHHLVQTLIKQKRQATLGMAKAQVTVFFSDIAGFTTMAESLDPNVLMDVLGTYLEEMSNIVMEHGGVVGEFVGDEIMAWWNAPPLEFHGNHTVAALTAALKQQHRLALLREDWCRQGLPAVTARMGLVRGSVLAGNLGSAQRMKYGLVGDNVNLASRLEGLCKMYGVSCLVDDAVHAAPEVQERFVLRPIDLVAVKGRTGATEIFELMAKREQNEEPEERHGKLDQGEAEGALALAEDFAAVQTLYRGRDFGAALAALGDLEARWPDDRPCKILRARCAELVAAPPADLEAWSPLVQLTEK